LPCPSILNKNVNNISTTFSVNGHALILMLAQFTHERSKFTGTTYYYPSQCKRQ